MFVQLLFTGMLLTLSIGKNDPVAVIPAGPGQAEVVAEELTRQLTVRGTKVLPLSEVTTRMQKYLNIEPQDNTAIEKAFKDAHSAYKAFDVEKHVQIMEATIKRLEEDMHPTAKRLQYLAKARMEVADKLLNLAGRRESGSGETVLGRRACSHLEAAIRADPLMVMPSEIYPPRTRRLMQTARKKVRASATGTLEVTSNPSGATLFLEGRDIGSTPYKVTKNLPLGTYRIWATKAELRSKTHTVTVKGNQASSLHIDLGFDSAMVPDKGRFRSFNGELLTDEIAIKTGSILRVPWIVVTGVVEYEASTWTYAALYDVKGKKAARRGAVLFSQSADGSLELQTLADFVAQGKNGDGAVKALDDLGGKKEEPAPQVSQEESPNILLWTGAGIAAAGLVATAGFAFSAFYFDQVRNDKSAVWDERSQAQTLSQLSLGASIIGAVALVGGAALATLSVIGEEEDNGETAPDGRP